MVFSDTTSEKSGLIQACEFWLYANNYGAISDNTERLATFTQLLNRGMDNVTRKIYQSDNGWVWDDSNYTALPEDTQTLVNDQAEYTIDESHLILRAVYAKDSEGDEYPLWPITEEDIRRRGVAPEEWFDDSGVPKYYRKVGNRLVLYPAPDTAQVTAAEGLRTSYQREAEYFVVADTTQEPGFPRDFHELVVLYACYQYSLAHVMDKAPSLKRNISELENDLKDRFARRDKDAKHSLTPRYYNPE